MLGAFNIAGSLAMGWAVNRWRMKSLLVAVYAARALAVLFGITMLSHQIGGFLGAWQGGVLFEATGGYTVLWLIDAGLAIGAALLHLPIREAPVARRLAPVAA